MKNSSLVGKKLRDEFNLALIEASIDCSAHYQNLEQSIKNKFKCKVCAPTGNILYHADMFKDLNSENNCKDLAEGEKMDVKEIKLKIGDKEELFYYAKKDNNIKIYIFDEGISGYIPMMKSHPFYGDIVRKILKFD
jgi:hypothetical protein